MPAPETGGQLWFLSLLGSQQAVRALWARLVKGETAYLGEDELTGGPPLLAGPRGVGHVAIPRRPPALRLLWGANIPSVSGRAASGKPGPPKPAEERKPSV